MDIYIVMDGAQVVGASARRQGAELLRVTRAQKIADESPKYAHVPPDVRQQAIDMFYARMHIVDTELQDVE